MSSFGGDVQGRRVGQLVARRDHEVLVELHELFDDRNGSFAGRDVRASAPVLRGHGDLFQRGHSFN